MSGGWKMREMQCIPEPNDGDPPHTQSRSCWCNPTLMVSGGWIRVIHREER